MNVEDFSRLTFTVAYNKDELEVLDICSTIPEKELATELIEGGEISVTKVESGLINFKVTKQISPDKTWSGIVNSIRLSQR